MADEGMVFSKSSGREDFRDVSCFEALANSSLLETTDLPPHETKKTDINNANNFFIV